VAGILAAARAEFDGIEHGTFMTADGPSINNEALQAILTGGVVVSAIAGLRAGAEPPVEVKRFMEQLQAVRAELVRAGVPLIPGPDGGIGPLKPHNIMASAVLRLSEIMTNTEALRAGTETAAGACRVADRKGKIAANHDADLVVLDADPTTDIRTILNPVAVYHRGALVA
jgi:imidazolonepropionase-like amidohydrolase